MLSTLAVVAAVVAAVAGVVVVVAAVAAVGLFVRFFEVHRKRVVIGELTFCLFVIL